MDGKVPNVTTASAIESPTRSDERRKKRKKIIERREEKKEEKEKEVASAERELTGMQLRLETPAMTATGGLTDELNWEQIPPGIEGEEGGGGEGKGFLFLLPQV